MMSDFVIEIWLRYLLDKADDRLTKESKARIRRIIKVLAQRNKRKEEKYK